MDNIFEKIISGELPAYIIYEDELVIAFLDINPVNKGHTLVVPKKKFINILDGDPDTLAHMMKVAQKIAQALIKDENVNGVKLIMNNGEAAEQDVWHSHLHVVPRMTNDNAYKNPSHITCTEEEFIKTKERLVGALHPDV